MTDALKHLIECHCVLPQYRDRRETVYHKFIVFSVLDHNNNIIPKNAQCNNCGVVHRITDVGRSEILLGREASASLITISDLKISMPSSIVATLETYNVDLATWEEASWILENNKWDSFIVLAIEEKDDLIEGKCLRFIGPQTIKIEPYSRSTLFPSR